MMAKRPHHECRHRMTGPILFTRQREVGLQLLLYEVVQGGTLRTATRAQIIAVAMDQTPTGRMRPVRIHSQA